MSMSPRNDRNTSEFVCAQNNYCEVIKLLCVISCYFIFLSQFQVQTLDLVDKLRSGCLKTHTRRSIVVPNHFSGFSEIRLPCSEFKSHDTMLVNGTDGLV